MSKSFQIAIDGPAGAGKSTVARAVARQLGITHLDTGAMYRAVGLKALRSGVDPEDEAGVSALLADTQLEILLQDGEQLVYLDAQDVSREIRSPAAAAAASAVSRYAAVRHFLVDKQRRIAGATDVVMDGRDIGTNVLPAAPHKFFLTASARVRAQRRALEMEQKGQPVDLDALTRDILRRDEQDSTRALNPLCKAPDAIEIDTTGMTQQQVVQTILDRIGTKA
ncbi:MAG: (d)CMP kinase [Eubacteriales bacterium]|nr:(d)CMP kinase [Eubacteriales bacterium]